MKKFIWLLLCFVLSGLHGIAQRPDPQDFKKFNTVLEVFNDFYRNVPDSVKNRLINGGVSTFLFYEQRLGKSIYSFAIGGGISSHNFYSNALIETDSSGVTGFYLLGNRYPGISYKRNKFNITYVDFPLEFRMRTDKNLRTAIGFRLGIKLDSHTKYIGNDYLTQGNKQIHAKFKNIENLYDLRFGIAARLGWKFINVSGFYSLSGMFEKDKGPQIAPVSVGISLMPF